MKGDYKYYPTNKCRNEQTNQTISVRKRLINQPFGPKKSTFKQFKNIKLDELLKMLEEDTRGFPKYKLPIPFRKYSTKVYFRH